MKKYCEVEFHGVRWSVSGEWTPGVPAKAFLPNGDPGYPAESSILEGAEVILRQGRNVSGDFYDILTEEAYNEIVDLALEVLDADEGSEYDIEADVPF